jgi:hypothetical protein
MQSVQNIKVINGKPSIYGDMGKALLSREAVDIDEDDIDIIRETRIGRCKITRPGRNPVQRTFSEQDARDAHLWDERQQVPSWDSKGARIMIDNPAPWHRYPLRQLAWRAFWFAARDCCADLLHGMRGVEEVLDYAIEEAPAGPPGGGTDAGREAAAAGGIHIGKPPDAHEPDPGGYAAPQTWAPGAVIQAEVAPKCPKCQGPTKKKNGGRKRDTIDPQGQPVAGEWYPPFWSCCDYPRCRGTAKVPPEEARAFMESVGVPQPEPHEVAPSAPREAPPSAPASPPGAQGEQLPLAPAPAPPPPKPHNAGDPATLEWILMKIRNAETRAEVQAARKLGVDNIVIAEDLVIINNKADYRWHELKK